MQAHNITCPVVFAFPKIFLRHATDNNEIFQGNPVGLIFNFIQDGHETQEIS